jgi:hypothetical protein
MLTRIFSLTGNRFYNMKTQYFIAQEKSNRFRKGQKVWIRLNCANHLVIYHKWRGIGRYVEGTIDKFSLLVGEIKTIEVDDNFAERISKI